MEKPNIKKVKPGEVYKTDLGEVKVTRQGFRVSTLTDAGQQIVINISKHDPNWPNGVVIGRVDYLEPLFGQH